MISDNFGRVIVEHDFGAFQTSGKIRLARFSSEQGLGLYMDAPIQSQYEIGRRLGVSGTPALFLESGDMLPGYVPPNRLIKILDGQQD